MSGPEPDAATDPRPWEQPGQWRRDGLPHRGRLLCGLAAAAAGCTVLGWCLVFPAPVGLGLGLLVWSLARRDLRLMASGQMDPAGRELTRGAGRDGLVAACLSLIPPAFCGLGWYALRGGWFTLP
jgi:hypothetical protein